jgi:hypothetical protein
MCHVCVCESERDTDLSVRYNMRDDVEPQIEYLVI